VAQLIADNPKISVIVYGVIGMLGFFAISIVILPKDGKNE
jgi:uncharacterized membrane protein YuzA (DUF378 family)